MTSTIAGIIVTTSSPPLGISKTGTDTILSLGPGRWYREGLLMIPRGAEQVDLSARMSENSGQRLCEAWANLTRATESSS